MSIAAKVFRKKPWRSTKDVQIARIGVRHVAAKIKMSQCECSASRLI